MYALDRYKIDTLMEVLVAKGTNWAELIPLLSLLVAGVGAIANATAKYKVEERKIDLQHEYLDLSREQMRITQRLQPQPNPQIQSPGQPPVPPVLDVQGNFYVPTYVPAPPTPFGAKNKH